MEQATILVVDDDREIVGAIAKLLELDGHQVLRAYDGLEALEILHEQTVHPHHPGCDDAPDGRPVRHHAGPAREKRAHSAAQRQNRGRGQNCRLVHRCRRLHDKTLQSHGTGRPGQGASAPLHDAGHGGGRPRPAGRDPAGRPRPGHPGQKFWRWTANRCA